MTDQQTDNIVMLSTSDNPFNPFDDFKRWYQFDVSHGYNSCAYLDRVAVVSEDLNEEETMAAVHKAINEILLFNLSGVHIKVRPDDFKKKTPS